MHALIQKVMGVILRETLRDRESKVSTFLATIQLTEVEQLALERGPFEVGLGLEASSRGIGESGPPVSFSRAFFLALDRLQVIREKSKALLSQRHQTMGCVSRASAVAFF